MIANLFFRVEEGAGVVLDDGLQGLSGLLSLLLSYIRHPICSNHKDSLLGVTLVRLSANQTPVSPSWLSSVIHVSASS